MPLTEKGETIKANMEKEYGAEKGKQVFYASKNAGTITAVDSAKGRLGNFPASAQRVFGSSPARGDATPPQNQRGPGGESWKPGGPIDAHLDSMRKGFRR